VSQINKKRATGALLGALGLIAATVLWVHAEEGGAATDNAYVRGDLTSVSSKVGGHITVVEVRDNEAVRAGDVLFRIDDSDYRARLAAAEANLAAAQARLASSRAEIGFQQALVRQARAQRSAAVADRDLARRTSDRRRELVEGGAVSRLQADESDAARLRADAGASASAAGLDAQQVKVDVLFAHRDAAVAAVAQAKAARDLARIDLENTVVQAPISGVVGNRQVRVGRLVAPGSPLLDIVPVSQLYVVANFKETQLDRIRPGQAAQVTVDGFPGVMLDGVVDSLAPGSGSTFSLLPADNASGNFVRVVQRVPVKVRLSRNPLPGRLVPGLSARVAIVGGAGS
jgi:membrane fusion protein (multidrug efflux system)